MYSNKLEVAIKSQGKVLREVGDEVFLPYNIEYSIFLKNKNSVRASVKVEIDGADVTDGVSLVVNPNDEFELERFIKNGNVMAGNRFKFIYKNEVVLKNRGNKIDDGLIRVEFQFEKVQIYPSGVYVSNTWFNQSIPGGSTTGSPLDPHLYSSTISSSGINPNQVDGITVPGSASNQEFDYVSNFMLEPQKHVIILHLLGEHNGNVISNTITTRTKHVCVTCGHMSKSMTAKFCSQCGTSLYTFLK